MNPITFNDGLVRVLATHPLDDARYIFSGWQKSPLFDHVLRYEHEQTVVGKIAALEKMPMPFKTFRLAIAETAVPFVDTHDDIAEEIGHGTYRSNMIVTKHADEMWIMVELKELWDKHIEMKRMSLPMYLLITNLRHDPNGKTEDAYFYKTSFWADGAWVHLFPALTAALEQFVSGALGSLATFLFDASLPSAHIAEVRPNKPSKSVEWTRARTHYTLIMHGHPANKKDVAEGARVAVDRDEELKRMAHDRRGHWRTYRHERYRFARHTTRWIKQAWVGPKEWQDAGGRQIYKILEPITEETQQHAE
jgi:hypothetical protein